MRNAEACRYTLSFLTVPAGPRTRHRRYPAVGPQCLQIKTGSLSRSDRIAKYNQLLRSEEDLACDQHTPAAALSTTAQVVCRMRWPALVLLALIALRSIRCGLARAAGSASGMVDRQLQRSATRIASSNSAMPAGCRSARLKSGNDAIEEHARYELGLIKQDEISSGAAEAALIVLLLQGLSLR